jgi:hypothetical protein
MDTNSFGGSAKIYQFPVRARAPVSGHRREDAKGVVDLRLARLPKVSFGDGWYHDAEIEAERGRKR